MRSAAVRYEEILEKVEAPTITETVPRGKNPVTETRSSVASLLTGGSGTVLAQPVSQSVEIAAVEIVSLEGNK